MNKKITASLIVLLSLLIISSNLAISISTVNKSNKIEVTNLPESYIIEDVPYVGQETNFYCFYASITMIYKYYGINTTLKEILHHSGIGYYFYYYNYYEAYYESSPLRSSSYYRYPLPGVVFSQSYVPELGDIFNLTTKWWAPEQQNCNIKDSWTNYWNYLCENITNNRPVITSVNTKYLPYINESGAHSIVVVGFNNTHIFYNDPATILYTNANDGLYANISITVFQQAINSTYATKFLILNFVNSSNICKNRKEVFTRAHEKNKRRLHGYVYQTNWTPVIGYNAVAELKKDLRIGLFHRFITINRYMNYSDRNGQLYPWFDYISLERKNCSQYLLENKNLYPNLMNREALLLEEESNHWQNISNCYKDIDYILKNNSFIKSLIFSIPITQKIRKELTKIYLIQLRLATGLD